MPPRRTSSSPGWRRLATLTNSSPHSAEEGEIWTMAAEETGGGRQQRHRQQAGHHARDLHGTAALVQSLWSAGGGSRPGRLGKDSMMPIEARIPSTGGPVSEEDEDRQHQRPPAAGTPLEAPRPRDITAQTLTPAASGADGPTLCIQVPTSETSCPLQKSRKSRWRRAARCAGLAVFERSKGVIRPETTAPSSPRR
jgi:hypothetical protein